ncbi:hypothetical protein, unknown function [Leishmania tarentolae]|uniref:Uncharacterized protein n=1 Tax=Leishmania tarentolae TaxID=5689 RepID=A0A640KSH2_LEITA|nr:hypothetical protein, unknown function [Leishmania tarentolae]
MAHLYVCYSAPSRANPSTKEGPVAYLDQVVCAAKNGASLVAGAEAPTTKGVTSSHPSELSTGASFLSLPGGTSARRWQSLTERYGFTLTTEESVFEYAECAAVDVTSRCREPESTLQPPLHMPSVPDSTRGCARNAAPVTRYRRCPRHRLLPAMLERIRQPSRATLEASESTAKMHHPYDDGQSFTDMSNASPAVSARAVTRPTPVATRKPPPHLMHNNRPSTVASMPCAATAASFASMKHLLTDYESLSRRDLMIDFYATYPAQPIVASVLPPPQSPPKLPASAFSVVMRKSPPPLLFSPSPSENRSSRSPKKATAAVCTDVPSDVNLRRLRLCFPGALWPFVLRHHRELLIRSLRRDAEAVLPPSVAAEVLSLHAAGAELEVILSLRDSSDLQSCTSSTRLSCSFTELWDLYNLVAFFLSREVPPTPPQPVESPLSRYKSRAPSNTAPTPITVGEAADTVQLTVVPLAPLPKVLQKRQVTSVLPTKGSLPYITSTAETSAADTPLQLRIPLVFLVEASDALQKLIDSAPSQLRLALRRDSIYAVPDANDVHVHSWAVQTTGLFVELLLHCSDGNGKDVALNAQAALDRCSFTETWHIIRSYTDGLASLPVEVPIIAKRRASTPRAVSESRRLDKSIMATACTVAKAMTKGTSQLEESLVHSVLPCTVGMEQPLSRSEGAVLSGSKYDNSEQNSARSSSMCAKEHVIPTSPVTATSHCEHEMLSKGCSTILDIRTTATAASKAAPRLVNKPTSKSNLTQIFSEPLLRSTTPSERPTQRTTTADSTTGHRNAQVGDWVKEKSNTKTAGESLQSSFLLQLLPPTRNSSKKQEAVRQEHLASRVLCDADRQDRKSLQAGQITHDMTNREEEAAARDTPGSLVSSMDQKPMSLRPRRTTERQLTHPQHRSNFEVNGYTGITDDSANSTESSITSSPSEDNREEEDLAMREFDVHSTQGMHLCAMAGEKWETLLVLHLLQLQRTLKADAHTFFGTLTSSIEKSIMRCAEKVRREMIGPPNMTRRLCNVAQEADASAAVSTTSYDFSSGTVEVLPVMRLLHMPDPYTRPVQRHLRPRSSLSASYLLSTRTAAEAAMHRRAVPIESLVDASAKTVTIDEVEVLPPLCKSAAPSPEQHQQTFQNRLPRALQTVTVASRSSPEGDVSVQAAPLLRELSARQDSCTVERSSLSQQRTLDDSSVGGGSVRVFLSRLFDIPGLTDEMLAGQLEAVRSLFSVETCVLLDTTDDLVEDLHLPGHLTVNATVRLPASYPVIEGCSVLLEHDYPKLNGLLRELAAAPAPQPPPQVEARAPLGEKCGNTILCSCTLMPRSTASAPPSAPVGGNASLYSVYVEGELWPATIEHHADGLCEELISDVAEALSAMKVSVERVSAVPYANGALFTFHLRNRGTSPLSGVENVLQQCPFTAGRALCRRLGGASDHRSTLKVTDTMYSVELRGKAWKQALQEHGDLLAESFLGDTLQCLCVNNVAAGPFNVSVKSLAATPDCLRIVYSISSTTACTDVDRLQVAQMIMENAFPQLWKMHDSIMLAREPQTNSKKAHRIAPLLLSSASNVPEREKVYDLDYLPATAAVSAHGVEEVPREAAVEPSGGASAAKIEEATEKRPPAAVVPIVPVFGTSRDCTGLHARVATLPPPLPLLQATLSSQSKQSVRQEESLLQPQDNAQGRAMEQLPNTDKQRAPAYTSTSPFTKSENEVYYGAKDIASSESADVVKGAASKEPAPLRSSAAVRQVVSAPVTSISTLSTPLTRVPVTPRLPLTAFNSAASVERRTPCAAHPHASLSRSLESAAPPVLPSLSTAYVQTDAVPSQVPVKQTVRAVSALAEKMSPGRLGSSLAGDEPTHLPNLYATGERKMHNKPEVSTPSTPTRSLSFTSARPAAPTTVAGVCMEQPPKAAVLLEGPTTSATPTMNDPLDGAHYYSGTSIVPRTLQTNQDDTIAANLCNAPTLTSSGPTSLYCKHFPELLTPASSQHVGAAKMPYIGINPLFTSPLPTTRMLPNHSLSLVVSSMDPDRNLRRFRDDLDFLERAIHTRYLCIQRELMATATSALRTL